ncbi:MAG: hypothetical protein U9R56_05450, partial [candidate division Zixibacteria bacterium]|nr:hypothetical protein [candidate division Zixibacteria bacterium]
DCSKTDKLFPFWSLAVPEAQADYYRKLFGGLYSSERLVIPAFKMASIEATYRLSKRMSAAMPQLELQPVEKFDSRNIPVTVGLDDAATIADVIIYRAELNRKHDFDGSSPNFVPKEVTLVFAPFHPESYFYVDSVLNSVTFEKNYSG